MNKEGTEKWDKEVLEEFREKFRCPVCIGIMMNYECQPIDCVECNGSTFNPDWDYQSAESFLLKKLQEKESQALEAERIRIEDGVNELMFICQRFHSGGVRIQAVDIQKVRQIIRPKI